MYLSTSAQALYYEFEQIVQIWGDILWFYATLYFYSTTFQREILYFLCHYIYITAGGTSHFADYNFAWKTNDLLIWYDAVL